MSYKPKRIPHKKGLYLNLTRGLKTRVDRDIFKIFKDKNLFACGGEHKYAGFVQKGKITYLHRFIMKPKNGQEVDHINGIKSDNRRKNLRIVTRLRNCWNEVRLRKSNTSGFHGVYFDKRRNAWIARIRIGSSKRILLGQFKSRKMAGRAYKNAKKKFHRI